MRKSHKQINLFSFDKKEAAKKGLKPEENSKKVQEAAEERRTEDRRIKAQTSEATLEKEADAKEDY